MAKKILYRRIKYNETYLSPSQLMQSLGFFAATCNVSNEEGPVSKHPSYLRIRRQSGHFISGLFKVGAVDPEWDAVARYEDGKTEPYFNKMRVPEILNHLEPYIDKNGVLKFPNMPYRFYPNVNYLLIDRYDQYKKDIAIVDGEISVFSEYDAYRLEAYFETDLYKNIIPAATSRSKEEVIAFAIGLYNNGKVPIVE